MTIEFPADPISHNPEKRTECINRSPILKTFINPELVQNRQEWLTALTEQGKKSENEIKQLLEDETWKYTFFSLALFTMSHEIFPEDIMPHEAINVVRSLYLIGYEIGNPDEFSYFSQDIFRQLRLSGLCPSTHQYSINMHEPIWSIFDTGCFLKQKAESENLSAAEVFAQFIED